MKVQKEKQEKKEDIKCPKVGELHIRLLHEKDKDAYGNWVFVPAFQFRRTADIRIHAKTVSSARRLLEDYLYNELTCQDDIWEES